MELKYSAKDTYTLSIDEVLAIFQINVDTGLSKVEAEKRSKEYGPNVYISQKPKNPWLILLEQFKSPIVYLLIFGIVSFLIDFFTIRLVIRSFSSLRTSF